VRAIAAAAAAVDGKPFQVHSAAEGSSTIAQRHMAQEDNCPHNNCLEKQKTIWYKKLRKHITIESLHMYELRTSLTGSTTYGVIIHTFSDKLPFRACAIVACTIVFLEILVLDNCPFGQLSLGNRLLFNCPDLGLLRVQSEAIECVWLWYSSGTKRGGHGGI
jgi:hypothetical protein